jgi:hypothetical protein
MSSQRDAIDAAVDALEDALEDALGLCDGQAGLNLPELLREALERVARRHGGSHALVRHRPGSWEAVHVAALAELADL